MCENEGVIMSDIGGKIVLFGITVLNFTFLIFFFTYLRWEIMTNLKDSPENGLLIKILSCILFAKLREPDRQGRDRVVHSVHIEGCQIEEDKEDKNAVNGSPPPSTGNNSF